MLVYRSSAIRLRSGWRVSGSRPAFQKRMFRHGRKVWDGKENKEMMECLR